MPVISFISPKGGVGKTTAATLMATQLARKTQVIIIDADPNRPILAWSQLNGCPANIRIVSDANQENILDKIEEAAAEAPFVVVDCEGTASLTVAYAIGASDLVVVPTQGSQLDAKQAAKALSLIKNTERQSRRPIPHAVLLTRTNPIIKPRTLSAIHEQLRAHGIRLFDTQLHEREAFKAMFSFGGALETLDPSQVANIDKAVANARAFVAEAIELLKNPDAVPAQEVA
ncbi:MULTISPECIES: ParA family protein [Asticcacaulis]|jgi:chromosome partitioning protein|uniref:Chromosome (Plasmid) partitioning protein ParA n=2 Tax=Asticcacaulis TaxID=76890 RepID=A0A3G9G2Y8_9CAUL|nr:MULTISPECIES: ParA family protein [Asticcacaulis]MCA1936017.1 ParA family protein [Asticcacaulis sp.]MDC7695756.1 ParA family protein [Asticcacaulis currens]BBF81690.1 chromosome (plasmid) partitioning protein ParA [Asticcacaulis excentricus]BEV11725.1 ParA family protein [Asticcacaulis sp. DW145]